MKCLYKGSSFPLFKVLTSNWFNLKMAIKRDNSTKLTGGKKKYIDEHLQGNNSSICHLCYNGTDWNNHKRLSKGF